MSPITHLLISWNIANRCRVNKKDRLLITTTGIIPDIDGLVIIDDLILCVEKGFFNY